MRMNRGDTEQQRSQRARGAADRSARIRKRAPRSAVARRATPLRTRGHSVPVARGAHGASLTTGIQRVRDSESRSL